MATFKQYQTKDGKKLWLFQVYLGKDKATGKEVRTTRRNFPSKKIAQKSLNELMLDYEKNGLKKQKITLFKEVYEIWFDNYRNTVKESTSIATERYFKIHILPIFQNLRIDKIDLKTCQKAVNEWANKLYVFKVVTQYASKVMDYAINLDLITINPFTKIIRPVRREEKAEKKLKFYTLDELKTVFNHLEKKINFIQDNFSKQKYFSELDYALFRLLAFSGLRIGEALCLTWDDMDFKYNTLIINKNLSKTKQGYKISTPKTKSSNRTILLDNKTIQILQKWKIIQEEILFLNGVKKANIIFCDFEGQYMNRQDIYQRATRISIACNLHNIGSHGYRHTHASMLFESGASMKETQDRLGHSSIEMTMDVYTHLTKKTKEQTADKLAKYANF